MMHIVMFSGGVGSWAAARRVAEAHGPANVRLLFTDTKMEDEDLYRFLDSAAANVGAELVTIEDGRDPWQVFFDSRFLGNTRADPCSRILKRDLARSWIEAHYPDPDSVTLYVGIDWTEEHRMRNVVRNWSPYTVEAPLCERPYLSKGQWLDELQAAGIEVPRLYAMGFPHNNCGGFCVKAGQAHFALLLDRMPERYHYHEEKEQEIRDYLKKDVAILRDRRGGCTRPMTLREFRENIQRGQGTDNFEWGGCGCFV